MIRRRHAPRRDGAAHGRPRQGLPRPRRTGASRPGLARAATAALLGTLVWVALASTASAQAPSSLSVAAGRAAYAPGATVAISGSLAPAAAGVSVALQVLGPTGDIVFVDQVDPDTSGRFADSLALAVDAATGTYTVEAVAQPAAGPPLTARTTFVVARPPSGSVDVAAASTAYAPGASVQLHGAVTPSPGAGVAVTVRVDDPAGRTVFTGGAATAQDGSFSASFILAGSAPAGAYAISATALLPGGSLSGRGGFTVAVAATPALTLAVGQSAYLAGGTVRLTGSVSPAAARAVTVHVTDPDRNTVLSTSVASQADGSFSVTFALAGTAAAGRYVATASVGGPAGSAADSVDFSVVPPGAPVLSVGATGGPYLPGATVGIAGAVSPPAPYTVALQVDGPGGGASLFIGQVQSAGGSGGFHDSFALAAGARPGAYTLYATADTPTGPVAANAIFQVNQLPEVPAAVILPGILAALLLRRRRQT